MLLENVACLFEPIGRFESARLDHGLVRRLLVAFRHFPSTGVPAINFRDPTTLCGANAQVHLLDAIRKVVGGRKYPAEVLRVTRGLEERPAGRSSHFRSCSFLSELLP